MITYAIDATSAAKQQKTGVERYAFALIEAMKACPLQEDERVVLYTQASLPDSLARLPERWSVQVLSWPFSRGWMKFRVAWECIRRSPTVLFVPAQGLPFMTGKTRVVTTVHDVEFLRVPQLFAASVVRRLRAETQRAIRHARALCVVSQVTATALERAYEVPAARMQVTPLAPETAYQPSSFARTQRKPMFVYVGRIESRKNLELLVRAFAAFKRSRGSSDPYELLLIGKDGFGAERIRQTIDALELSAHVRLTGYLSDDVCIAHMQSAQAIVFPSAAEGFGLPVIEGFATATPVIASHIPAHEEVAMGAAELVAVDDVSAWAAALMRAATDEVWWNTRVEQGRERVRNYTWEACAQQTWKVLRSVIG